MPFFQPAAFRQCIPVVLLVLQVATSAPSSTCGARDECPTSPNRPTTQGLSWLQVSHKAQFVQNSGATSAVGFLQVAARQLSENLAQAAQRHASKPITSELLSSFRICGSCQHFERFGEAHDGGYLTCMDGKKNLKAAYSLGVEQHDKWSEDVSSKLKLPVNQFDCTVASGPGCEDCRFFSKCIKSAKGTDDSFPGRSVTLLEALELTGQEEAPERSLLLKMDIENSEWPIFADESKDVLSKFQQIIVEFHRLEQEQKHEKYLMAVKSILNAGFRVAHLHGNNNEGMYAVGEDIIPQILEVTFVSTGGAAAHEACIDHQVELPEDAPNMPWNAELRDAVLRPL